MISKSKKFFIILTILGSLSSKANALVLTSSSISSEGTIANKYTFNGFGCNGKNVSPTLNWRDIPKDAKSLALTVYDPDAPTGSGWWHWVVVNIPTNYNGFPADFGRSNKFSLTENTKQVRNDYSKYSYGGPCPPVGDKPHRYIFTLYALKVEKIDVDENSTSALAGYFINQNTIEKASINAFYGR